MFNIGGGEIMVIALIALIVVGPDQLPGLLRKVGQLTSQLQAMSSSFRSEFMKGIDQANPTKWTGEGTDDNPIVPRGYASSSAPPAIDPTDDPAPARTSDPESTESDPGESDPGDEATT